MKQKIVINMDLRCEKQKRKAIRIASNTTPGFLDTCSVEGPRLDRLVVIGDELDPICLVQALRKGLGSARLVSVTGVEPRRREGCEYYGYGRFTCPYAHAPSHVIVYEEVGQETSSTCNVM